MKKIISTLAVGAFFALTASADLARVEAGAGAWMQSPKGGLTYKSTGSDMSDETEEAKAYAWILVKHPVPIIPNARIEYSNVRSGGIASGTFLGFTATSDAKSSLEITQFDLIPYYNILDNTFWITLDLGVDFKVINASYEASGVTMTLPGNDYTNASAIVLPMAYVRSRVQIPATGFGIEADVKYVSYNSSTVYDVRAKVDYTFGAFPIVQPALEVGYRVQKFKTDELNDVEMDIDFAGVYAGLVLRF